MATGIRILGGTVIEVAEDFDKALDKWWPSQGAPSSSLEARSNSTYTKPDGRGRITILPQNVTALIEDYEANE